MGLGGCYSCIKYLLFAFNFIFWLAGCALLAVGIWALVDPESLNSKIDNDEIKRYFEAASIVLIIVGGIIMFVGFCGCCGAIRESQCMLATFFVFLFLFFILLLAIGIWLFVGKDSLIDAYDKTFMYNVNKWKEDGHQSDSGFLKYLKTQQENFDCCGGKGGGLLTYGPQLATACGTLSLKPNCPKTVFDKIDSNLVIVAGVAIGLGVVMLLGMIFAMMLCCAIRDVEHV